MGCCDRPEPGVVHASLIRCYSRRGKVLLEERDDFLFVFGAGDRVQVLVGCVLDDPEFFRIRGTSKKALGVGEGGVAVVCAGEN